MSLFNMIVLPLYAIFAWWLACYLRFAPVSIQRTWFTFIFAITLIFLWISTGLVQLLLRSTGIFDPIKCGELNGLLTGVAFKWCAFMNPHIRLIPIHGKETDQVFLDGVKEKKHLFGINHTSFFDGFAGLAILPLPLAKKLRSIYKSSLSKIPLWGATYQRRNDFPVHFTSDDKFSTDKEKQAQVSENMAEWVEKHHGTIAIFPEGQLNQNPLKIQPIRHGMMKFAVEHKMPIYVLIQMNSFVSWPLDAKGIGGYPADIYYDVKKFEPIRIDPKTKKPVEESTEELSERMRTFMQDMVQDVLAFQEKNKSK